MITFTHNKSTKYILVTIMNLQEKHYLRGIQAFHNTYLLKSQNRSAKVLCAVSREIKHHIKRTELWE